MDALSRRGHPGRVVRRIQLDRRPRGRGHCPAGGAAQERPQALQPTVRYDSSQARSPLVTGHWHQCHGAHSQLFFTLPMQLAGENWQPPTGNLPEMGCIEGVDAFVRAAVNQAYLQSPLYRHYNVSYVPTQSRMCRQALGAQRVGAVGVTPYSARGATLFNTSCWVRLPAYGINAFPLYGYFCGRVCFPLAAVCQAGPELRPSFPADSLSAAELLQAEALWAPSWQCPALQLSDQSARGALSASEMATGCRACSATTAGPAEAQAQLLPGGQPQPYRATAPPDLPVTGPSSPPRPCYPFARLPTLGLDLPSSTRRLRCAPTWRGCSPSRRACSRLALLSQAACPTL